MTPLLLYILMLVYKGLFPKSVEVGRFLHVNLFCYSSVLCAANVIYIWIYFNVDASTVTINSIDLIRAATTPVCSGDELELMCTLASIRKSSSMEYHFDDT